VLLGRLRPRSFEQAFGSLLELEGDLKKGQAGVAIMDGVPELAVSPRLLEQAVRIAFVHETTLRPAFQLWAMAAATKASREATDAKTAFRRNGKGGP
jgi:hypothetical protein